MHMVRNDLGLMLTEDGQWAIKEESPTLFIVRERIGPNVWDWRNRGRASTWPEAVRMLCDTRDGKVN